MKAKIYCGHLPDGGFQVFKSETTPTWESHYPRYNFVMGPFHTMRGAKFYRDHYLGNPHITTVSSCERVAKEHAKKNFTHSIMLHADWSQS